MTEISPVLCKYPSYCSHWTVALLCKWDALSAFLHAGHPLNFYSERFHWIHLFSPFILPRILWSPFCSFNTLPQSYCAKSTHTHMRVFAIQYSLAWGLRALAGIVLMFFFTLSLFSLYFFHSRELMSSSMPAAWTTLTPQPSGRDWPMGQGQVLARCSAVCEWETRRTRSMLYVTWGGRESFVCTCVWICVCSKCICLSVFSFKGEVLKHFLTNRIVWAEGNETMLFSVLGQSRQWLIHTSKAVQLFSACLSHTSAWPPSLWQLHSSFNHLMDKHRHTINRDEVASACAIAFPINPLLW